MTRARPARIKPFAKSGCASGGETLVAMMQATDLRYCNHSSDPVWLNRARDRAILVERKMGARSMVILEVGRQDATQMAFVEDHHVIQVLAADRAYDPLDIGFCHGDRGAVTTSVMPMALTRLQNSEPYDASRSGSRYRGAVSQGNASVTWRESQAAVGCSVTAARMIFLRSWPRMIVT